MKILYDHSVFQNQQYGGISRYFYEIITRMAHTKGVDVDVFQGLHINEYDVSTHKEIYNSYRGIKPLTKIPRLIRSHLFLLPNKVLFNSFYKASKPDVFHPTYYYQSIEKHHKSPIVLTVYDMIHELYPDQLRYSKYTIDAKRKSIEAADRIICISNNTKKDLMAIYGVAEDKIKVIYLANSLPKFNSVIKYMDLTEVCPTKKPFLLYVGDRNGTYKNFSTLLDAYVTSFKSRFDLVCFGGGGFNKKEMEVINNHNCNDNVTQLSGSDYILMSLYRNAFAFICPSHYEGFGLPLLEAMGMGCPVIAANSSCIPEVVGDAALLFNPNSKDDLIERVKTLEKDSNKRNDLIKLGLSQEDKFSWEKTTKETLKVYEEVSKSITLHNRGLLCEERVIG